MHEHEGFSVNSKSLDKWVIRRTRKKHVGQIWLGQQKGKEALGVASPWASAQSVQRLGQAGSGGEAGGADAYCGRLGLGTWAGLGGLGCSWMHRRGIGQHGDDVSSMERKQGAWRAGPRRDGNRPDSRLGRRWMNEGPRTRSDTVAAGILKLLGMRCCRRAAAMAGT